MSYVQCMKCKRKVEIRTIKSGKRYRCTTCGGLGSITISEELPDWLDRKLSRSKHVEENIESNSIKKNKLEQPARRHCIVCKAIIPSQRIETIPETQHCVRCASTSGAGAANRKADEPLGTRLDFKRDRASWKDNSRR